MIVDQFFLQIVIREYKLVEGGVVMCLYCKFFFIVESRCRVNFLERKSPESVDYFKSLVFFSFFFLWIRCKTCCRECCSHVRIPALKKSKYIFAFLTEKNLSDSLSIISKSVVSLFGDNCQVALKQKISVGGRLGGRSKAEKSAWVVV